MSKKIIISTIISLLISTNCFAFPAIQQPEDNHFKDQAFIQEVLENFLVNVNEIGESRYLCFCFAVDENGNDIPTKGFRSNDNTRAAL